MKLKSVLGVCVVVFVLSFFLLLLSNKNFSQAQGTGPIFDTFTINLSGAELNSVQGLTIDIIFSGGIAQLNKGVTFKGTGASLLLSDVDITKNVIAVVLNGKITDGKASLTCMVNPASISGSPSISVTKVQASGGTDITSALTIDIKTSFSISPSPTPSPTPSPSPTPTPTPTATPSPTVQKKSPTITLIGPNILVLRFSGSNSARLKAKSSNFTSKSKCQATSSDKLLAQIRPSKFLLSPTRNNKILLVSVHPLTARDLIKNSSSKNVVINVSCSNGAKGSKELSIK